jgi:2-octaprenyl-6-methoxyphenol hydroxylase
MSHYDMIIVGGGLVGAGLAVALRETGLRLALVDARLPSNDDPRLFALNAGSCQFLENIGIWSTLSQYAAPIHQVHVTHQGHFGSVRLKREEAGLSALGHVIPARYIETALNDALISLPHCTLYRPATLHSLAQQDNVAQLKIVTETGEKILHASLVIGADGTESTVRKQLNIHTDIFDYDQSAIVTRTHLKRAHQQIAHERFQGDGAIAMLPLVGEECATIWSGSQAKMSSLMALSDEAFLDKLQDEFGYRLGKLQAIQKRHMFPLRRVCAEKAVDQCVFLLGNSAHTLHPIAAQGFNLALYEVAMLVENIVAKRTLKTADLHDISQQIQKHQSASMGVSHRLTQIFSDHSVVSGLATQLGMIGLNAAIPLKKRFMRTMLGHKLLNHKTFI